MLSAFDFRELRDTVTISLILSMSPPIPRIARVPLTSKQPEACPHCGGCNVTRRGTRKKKLEIVQLWRCAACQRTFTPGPAALCNAATEAAALIIPAVGNNILRHETLQKFMLANDGVTVAIEIPIWLTEDDIDALERQHDIELARRIGNTPRVITRPYRLPAGQERLRRWFMEQAERMAVAFTDPMKLYLTDDFREAVAAHVEKRGPSGFKGR